MSVLDDVGKSVGIGSAEQGERGKRFARQSRQALNQLARMGQQVFDLGIAEAAKLGGAIGPDSPIFKFLQDEAIVTQEEREAEGERARQAGRVAVRTAAGRAENIQRRQQGRLGLDPSSGRAQAGRLGAQLSAAAAEAGVSTAAGQQAEQ